MPRAFGRRRPVAQTPAHMFYDPTVSQPFRTSLVLHERLNLLLDAWPRAICVRVLQQAPLQSLHPFAARRTLLAEVPIVVPGGAGATYADPTPRGYEWTNFLEAPPLARVSVGGTSAAGKRSRSTGAALVSGKAARSSQSALRQSTSKADWYPHGLVLGREGNAGCSEAGGCWMGGGGHSRQQCALVQRSQLPRRRPLCPMRVGSAAQSSSNRGRLGGQLDVKPHARCGLCGHQERGRWSRPSASTQRHRSWAQHGRRPHRRRLASRAARASAIGANCRRPRSRTTATEQACRGMPIIPPNPLTPYPYSSSASGDCGTCCTEQGGREAGRQGGWCMTSGRVVASAESTARTAVVSGTMPGS